MSENNEQDTDMLLAILASMIEPPIPEQDVLLEALINANGDVESAAASLRHGAPVPYLSKKRTLSGVLDNWLAPSQAESSQPKKKSRSVQSTHGTMAEQRQTSSNKQRTIVENERGESSGSTNPISNTSTSVSGLSEPSTSPSKSPSKPVISLTEVLRAPPSEPPRIPRLAPLTLANPSLVEKHTPCTLHLNVLPPELATRLFYTMANASQNWKPNKWWLFDRVVESPHKTSFFARQVNGLDDDASWQQAAQYWYNGRATDPPQVFSSDMEEACRIIEDVVNDALRGRRRYPLEWGGSAEEGRAWKANVAASNCYAGGKEGVGFHSDQMTYLGPFPTIASLSLGTTRIFRLREVIPKEETDTRQAQTFNIPVSHNSLVIMHASTQERFKHSIPQQKAIDLFRPSLPPPFPMDHDVANYRINITFRFYRPDFHPETTPRCRCNSPCILRADMKGRKEEDIRYFWMCYAGAQNDGKGCTFVQVMDCIAEGRGPFVKDLKDV